MLTIILGTMEYLDVDINRTEYFRTREQTYLFAAKNGTHHFGPIYDYYFRDIRNQVQNFLEIGVEHGDSIKMWRNYFPNATIWGIDIKDIRKVKDLDRVNFLLGDQGNVTFLESIDCMFDFIVDDGSHESKDQMTSFSVLFKKLRPGGIYFIEDTFTSFSRKQGMLTIDFMKYQINKFQCYGKCESMRWDKVIAKVPEVNDEIYTMHVYLGMVAFIKVRV